MKTVILSESFAPFTSCTCSKDVASLSAQLVSDGHEVTLIMVGFADAVKHEIPLARRLTPVEVEFDGATVEFSRFDGRTSTGVNVYILTCEQKPVQNERRDIFGRAAESLLKNTLSDFEKVISVNNRFSVEWPIFAKSRRVLLLTEDKAPKQGMELYNRVIVLGKSLANRVEKGETDIPEEMILTGKAAVVPCVPTIPKANISAEGSLKVACQYRFGLPVRDVPLFFFFEPDKVKVEKLESFLRQDIQVLVKERPESDVLERLAENYPDRLALIPKGEYEISLLEGCDFSFCLTESEVVNSLAACTCPVAQESQRGPVVELDASLKSGSGICFGGASDNTVAGALAEAVSCYKKGRVFGLFRLRLSHHIATWQDVSSRIIECV